MDALRLCIFNALLGLAGGGELLAIKMCRALEESGFDATMYTYSTGGVDVDRALKLLSPDYRPKLVVMRPPLIHEVLGISGRLIRLKRLLLASDFLKRINLLRECCDVIIDASSNMPTDADISYIHYPVSISSKAGGIHQLYELVIRKYVSDLTGNTLLVLTNSSWTLSKFRGVWGSRYLAEVLYPPVDVEYFSEVADNHVRDDLIVTITRFTPEKRLEAIVDIAKRLPNYEFVIAGTTSNYSRPVIKSLRGLMERLNVENLRILTDIPRSELRELLGRAKFYLHPPFPEHFGISVVEAASAGCIPIVYRDGGAWVDVVSKIDSRLGYGSVDEVPKIVEGLSDEEVSRLRVKAIDISKNFNYELFKGRVNYYVGYVLRLKGRSK